MFDINRKETREKHARMWTIQNAEVTLQYDECITFHALTTHQGNHDTE